MIRRTFARIRGWYEQRRWVRWGVDLLIVLFLVVGIAFLHMAQSFVGMPFSRLIMGGY